MMRCRILLCVAVLAAAAFGPFHGGAGSVAVSTLALVRTLHNPTGTATPATGFWMIGQPFASGALASSPDVPPGNAVSANAGSTPIRAGFCQRKTDAASDIAWSQVMLDLSPAAVPGSGSENVTFTSAPGSWTYDSGGAATDADWEALNDTMTLVISATTSTGGADMTGTFTGSFNSSATIVLLCNNALGREVRVIAPLVNGSSQNHCYLQAEMDYWVTQTSGGGHGVTTSPIASLGPRALNKQVFKSTCAVSGANKPGVFTYTAIFARNGTTIRGGSGTAYSSGNQIAFTSDWFGRPDGQWDWDLNGSMNASYSPAYGDPGLYVTQDYTKVNGTYKLPAWTHGITYTGGFGYPPTVAITGINTTTGLFTTGNVQGLFEPQFHPPNAIELTGSLGGISSGLSLATTYWASWVSGTTFFLYDNQTDAFNAGSTGKLTGFGGAYTSGMSGEIDAAPNSTGLWYLDVGGAGGRPDISLTSEWGAAYMLAGTSSTPEAFQRQARVQAIDLGSYPTFAVASSGAGIGAIPTVLSSGGSLPNMAGGTGLTVQNTSFWIGCSAFSGDIGGGSGPTGGSGITDSCGLWHDLGGGINAAHTPGNPGYVVWLLEGNPYLQELGVGWALGDLGATYEPARNFSDPAVGGGTQYRGVCWSDAGSLRHTAWCVRDAAEGAEMAPPGSAEENFFQNALAQTSEWNVAWQSYKDGGVSGNYTALGVESEDDNGGGVLSGATLLGIYGTNFMYAYNGIAFNFAAIIQGDQATDLNTIANRSVGVLLMEDNENCPFWADAFNANWSLNDIGATPPGSYIATAGALGVGQGGTFSFSGTTVTSSVAGWVSGTGSTAGTIPFAAGDEYRPSNTDSDGGSTSGGSAAGLTDQTTYYVRNPSGATFNLTTTPGPTGGSLISFTTASNVGGTMVPAGQTCGVNTGDSFQSSMASGEAYWYYERAALGLAAERGVTGPGSQGTATAAFGINNTRSGANVPGIFATEGMWGFTSAP